MEIVIGSEKNGFAYSEKVLVYLIHKLFPNINIVNKNDDTCDIIVSSLNWGANDSDRWNKIKKNYIYFSGEPFNPPLSSYHQEYISILTTLSEDENSLYVPYFLFSQNMYLERKYTKNHRPYFLAYCNSNNIKERQDIFNIFVEKTSISACHSFSNYGNYPETRQPRIEGGWSGQEIIDTYKNYKFVIAMENIQKDGYITEKIINAFYSGAIPIYWGASNVNEFFNKKAFINVSNYNTFEECVEYVINMSDEEITAMMNEPIYMQDNDIVNLLNDEYNKKGNKTLDTYLSKMKKLIQLKTNS
jgi:hypothetical protein